MKRLQPQLSRVVSKAAHDVEAKAKVSILAGGKSGKLYKRGKTVHQASAPGEAPANEVGTLAAGIKVGNGDGPLWRVVQSTAVYSLALEFGSADGTIAPRPFMGPALESVRQPFRNAVRRVVSGS
jgi:hypothetical protein